MSPSVLLDPSAIWMVTESDSALEAEEYLAISKEWLSQEETRHLRVLISAHAVDSMYRLGVFPSKDYFQNSLDRLGLSHVVSPAQLAADVARFLARTPCLEDECGIQEALFDNIKIDPDKTMMIPTIDLRELSQKSAALVALCNKLVGKSFWAFCRGAPQTERLSLAADTIGLAGGNEIELSMHGELEAISRPRQFWKNIAAIDIWKKSVTIHDINKALCVRIAEIESSDVSFNHNFSFGGNFAECLKAKQAFGDSTYASLVMEKCARIVMGDEDDNTIDFRVDAKSTSPARVRSRDNAIAKRVHVTESHQGLRLMYWLIPGGKIEFATLGNKFEEHIDE